MISNYRMEKNHNFKWDKVMGYIRYTAFNKRLISEMVHIKKQKHEE